MGQKSTYERRLLEKRKTFASSYAYAKIKKSQERQVKFIHRIVVTKRVKLLNMIHPPYGIKPDDDEIYCGVKDSIDHSLRDCQVILASKKVILIRLLKLKIGHFACNKPK